MLVGNKHYRTIWLSEKNPEVVQIIDQRLLPHEFVIVDLRSVADFATAIKDMYVRGAPLIGATAAYGLCLALRDDPSDTSLEKAAAQLLATRPTAVNLRWALDDMRATLAGTSGQARIDAAYARAAAICDEDVEISRGIGQHGVRLLEQIAAAKQGGTVNVLTHCNAGSLATAEYGTATAPDGVSMISTLCPCTSDQSVLPIW